MTEGLRKQFMQQTGSGSQAETSLSTTITWSELESAFAPERLIPYLNHAAGDRDQAVALYLWNIALCESPVSYTHLTLPTN